MEVVPCIGRFLFMLKSTENKDMIVFFVQASILTKDAFPPVNYRSILKDL